eukprot:CCRYP_016041-RC/>CCRYP_016041-RC protein AED:0.46 eAED:1.00 QI:0/0/0/1/0/0/2/0/191
MIRDVYESFLRVSPENSLLLGRLLLRSGVLLSVRLILVIDTFGSRGLVEVAPFERDGFRVSLSTLSSIWAQDELLGVPKFVSETSVRSTLSGEGFKARKLLRISCASLTCEYGLVSPFASAPCVSVADLTLCSSSSRKHESRMLLSGEPRFEPEPPMAKSTWEAADTFESAASPAVLQASSSRGKVDENVS